MSIKTSASQTEAKGEKSPLLLANCLTHTSVNAIKIYYTALNQNKKANPLCSLQSQITEDQDHHNMETLDESYDHQSYCPQYPRHSQLLRSV